MKNKEAKLQYKIGDAVLTQESLELISDWQSHDNEGIDDKVCDLLKAVSFIACTASSYDFAESDRKESMKHIITLSEMAKTIEIFKK